MKMGAIYKDPLASLLHSDGDPKPGSERAEIALHLLTLVHQAVGSQSSSARSSGAGSGPRVSPASSRWAQACSQGDCIRSARVTARANSPAGPAAAVRDRRPPTFQQVGTGQRRRVELGESAQARAGPPGAGGQSCRTGAAGSDLRLPGHQIGLGHRGVTVKTGEKHVAGGVGGGLLRAAGQPDRLVQSPPSIRASIRAPTAVNRCKGRSSGKQRQSMGTVDDRQCARGVSNSHVGQRAEAVGQADDGRLGAHR